jgi:hypothetical protein
MSSPFVIEQTTKHYTVTWPGFHNIYGNPACYNLFKILFDQIKVDEAMIIVNDQHMITVNVVIWYQGHGEAYSEWLMSQHSITGAVFKEEKQAIMLQEELEKRYMWKLLKA